MGTIIMTTSLSPEKAKEITRIQKNRIKAGYPKVGTRITAVKTGYMATCQTRREGHVTKGKMYQVIDNLDMIDGHYHLVPDSYGLLIHLDESVLKEFFGITLKKER